MAKVKLKPPVRVNDELELTIETLASSGDGLTRHEGYTIFVPTALPGDAVLARISKVTPRFGVAAIVKRLKDSPDRIPAPCEVFLNCGGCSLQALHYDKQVEFKVQTVRDSLERIGKIELPPEIEIIPAESPYHYRNKGMFAIEQRGKRINIGFYRVGTHTVEDSATCDTLHPVINTVKEWVRGLVVRHRVSIYNEAHHRGWLRGLVVRHSPATGETLAGLVTTDDKPPASFLGDLADPPVEFGLTGMVQNINSEKTNVVLGPVNRLLWGREYFLDQLGDLQFRLSLNSFFQINPHQTVRLYDRIREWSLPADSYIVDAYCGSGGIALWLAQAGARVTGIEENPDAVDNAHQSAEINNLRSCEFIAGTLEDQMGQFSSDSGIDCIVLDPPRKGCSEPVLKALEQIGPKRIVYVSCNPATLARDLGALGSYRMTRLAVVDLFPQTSHVETVSLLERGGNASETGKEP